MRARLSVVLTLAAACQGTVSPRPDDAGARPEDAGANDASMATDAADAARPDAGSPPDPHAVCSDDGWCFESPYPAPEELRALALLGAGEALVVGQRGRALRVDEQGVTPVPNASVSDLYALHAVAPDDVWAVGAGSTFLHFDGTSFQPFTLEGDGGSADDDELRALWMAAHDDGWAAGAAGALWHYDGTTWTRQSASIGTDLRALWGADAATVFAVGKGSRVLRYDGSQWLSDVLPGGGEPFALDGSSASDVWAAGARGKLWHYDGSAWSEVPAPALAERNVVALRAPAPNELHVATDGGELFRYDGTAWHTASVGTDEPIYALAGSRSELFTAGAHGFLARFRGDERVTYARGSRDNYLDLSTAQGAAWVVGDAVLRLGAQGPEPMASASSRVLYGCFALSDQLAWAVGTAGTILRWDGASMVSSESGTDKWLRAVWASSAESAWVVGERGTVLGLFNGTLWQRAAVPTPNDLFDVWGSARDDVWIVGAGGTVVHGDGSAWRAMPSSTTVRLTSVWGRARDDVWFAGASGTVLHWNGKAIEVSQEGAAYTLYGLWGEGDALYAVGSGGTVLRRDGDAWHAEQTPTDATLFAIGRGQDGTLRAVGESGVILMRR